MKLGRLRQLLRAEPTVSPGRVEQALLRRGVCG